MRKFLNKKGSVTVEATLVLPIFISVVVCIAFIIKLIYVHEVMQHAISGAADEMASYSYLYEVTGIKDLHDEVRDGMDKSAQVFEKHKSTVLNSFDMFQTSSGKAVDSASGGLEAVSGGDINQAAASAEEVKKQVEKARESIRNISKVAGEIKKNPMREIKSILSLFGRNVFREIKNEFFVALVKLHMSKYLAVEDQLSANQRLMGFGIEGGFEGLNFEKSNFFKSKQEEDFDIIVTYKLKIPVPFNVLPRFNMVQRATVKAWLDGGVIKPTPTPRPSGTPSATPTGSPGATPSATPATGSQAIADVIKTLPTDFWALPKLERGKKIEAFLGRNQDEFAPIDILENRNVISMVTHDIRRDSFQGRGFYTTLESEIKKLAALTEYKKGNIDIRASDYDSKEFQLVIPDCAITPDQIKWIEDAKLMAAQNGIRMSVIVAKSP
ncbi:MAG: pilus assembly protein [Clostridia bacterium]|nr:pilus assembly protein [Clostridia bacterium]